MRARFRLAGALPGLVAALWPAAALAQRTEENVTTQSGDAFGRQVGNDKSGLYNAEDVRGFNPVDAGNARIEGLYFDQIDRLSPRVQKGSTVRVGVSALRYPFPAPTGLVDYTLAVAGGEPGASAELSSGSGQSLGLGGSIELNLPLAGEKLAAFGGVGFRNLAKAEGGEGRVRTFGGTLVWRPYRGARLLAFAGVFLNQEDEARPTLFPAGTALPPQIERGVDLSQPWADRNARNEHIGAVALLPLGSWRIEAGLFHIRKTTHSTFADLLFGVSPDGAVANRVIVADGGNLDTSLSGEARAVREWRSGRLAHSLTLSLRGRAKDRRFGGSARLGLGASTILAPDLRAEPAYALGAKSRDRVRQVTGGVAYSMVWDGGLSFDAGLSKSRYHKHVDFADPLLADPDTRDDPWLWNVAAAWALSQRVTLYAGASHGQEEALIAPEVALNRAEAPPAIRTSQLEAGLRFALTDHLTLVAGAFRISKPYYNLDPGLRYRQLGTLTNRGIELSLAGQLAPGLTLVGGSLFSDPTISGEAVETGLIGSSPVGQGSRRSVVNLDWRTGAGKGAWSLDLAVESLSARTANARNTLSAPARAAVNLGARYRFALGKTRLLVRPVVQNLFDSYGWQVSASGGLTYTQARSAYLQLTADF